MKIDIKIDEIHFFCYRVLKNSELYRQMELEGWRPFPGAMIGGDNDFPDKFNWLVTLFSESRDRESNLEPRIPEFFSKGKSSGGVNTGQGQASLFHSEN